MPLPQPHLWIDALPAPKPIPGPHCTAPGDLLLHLGEAWYPPAPAVVETLAGLANHLPHYPDSLCHGLREALAGYCGHGVTAEHLLVGNGSDGLIDLLVRAYAGPDRPVVAPAPTFFVYGHSAALAQAPLLTTGRRGQAEGFGLNLAQLPTRPSVLFLANPNNPTGDFTPLATLRALAEAQPETLLVIDECYYEFAGETALPLLADHPNVVILRSLSKSFALAGLRVGYAVAHPEIIATLTKVDQTFSVNVAAQACALAALESLDHYQPLFQRTQELRAQWTKQLTAAGLHVFPSRANILLCDTRALSPEPLAPRLREQGIYVADFHQRPGVEGCVRVTVGDEAALARVLAAMSGLIPTAR